MTLGDVHVNRDGTVRFNGDPIGYVYKLEDSDLGRQIGKWRCEVGDVAQPEQWPAYCASYAKTRKDAVLGAISGLEVPA